MNKILTQSVILILAVLAVLYPVATYLASADWANTSLLLTLFPIFGLIAFTLLWLHAMSGVFEPWLRRLFNFDTLVHVTAMIILVCIILHPLLLLTYFKFHITEIFGFGAKEIWFAIIGWCLLITYDIGKALKKHNFFVRHWQKILLISTVGFLLTFLHSLGIGDLLQSGAMRILWWFYGITAILATIYTYGIKRFLRN